MKRADNSFSKHTLNLLLIKKRPNNWHTKIEEYINLEHKNSFYLLDLYKCLRYEYKYGFMSQQNLTTTAQLLKRCMAKHSLGVKKPSQKTLKKIKDDNLPTRETD